MAQEHTNEEQARIAVASELRRGIHLLVGREPSVDDMTRLTGSLRQIFVAGEAHHGEMLVTTATGLFIDATEMMADLYGA